MEKPLFPEESQSAGISYTHQIANLSDWGLASGGLYTISITANTHQLASEFSVRVYELVGTDYVYTNLPYTITASGTLVLQVTESPDNRFVGRVNMGE